MITYINNISTRKQTYAQFLAKLPPTRHLNDAVILNDGTYVNIAPGGIVDDPLNSNKFIFYNAEFLGYITVGARIRSYSCDKATPDGPFTVESPVLVGTPASTDENGCRFGSVLTFGGVIYYYYVGIDASYDWRIHLATSTNGRDFTKQGVVLDFNDTDEKSISDPLVIKESDTWYMAYTVWDGASSPPNNNPGQSQVGMKTATSADGINWNKTNINVLPLGTSGALDDKNVEGGQLIKFRDKFCIMYNANKVGGNWRILIASADNIDDVFTKETGFTALGADDPVAWDDVAIAVPLYHKFSNNNERFYYQGRGSFHVGEELDNGASIL